LPKLPLKVPPQLSVQPAILVTYNKVPTCLNAAYPNGREFYGAVVGLWPSACLDCGSELPQVWKCVSCECCVSSRRGFYVSLSTFTEESYRVWCIWVFIVKPR